MTRTPTGIVTAVALASALACAFDKPTSPNEVRVPLFNRSIGEVNNLGTHLGSATGAASGSNAAKAATCRQDPPDLPCDR